MNIKIILLIILQSICKNNNYNKIYNNDYFYTTYNNIFEYLLAIDFKNKRLLDFVLIYFDMIKINNKEILNLYDSI